MAVELRTGGPADPVEVWTLSDPSYQVSTVAAALHTDIARPFGLLVLTLADCAVAEITWFNDSIVFPHFGLPRSVPAKPA